MFVKEMSLLDHIEELRKRLIKIILSITIISIIVFVFSIKEINYGDSVLYLPLPDIYDNISAQIIKQVKNDLLPSYVQLIVTTPTQAIMSQFLTSIFLGIVFSMPVIIHQIGKFLNPALYEQEKKMLTLTIIPAIILFISGGIFSYFLVTPFTFDFLYKYGLSMEIQTFLTIDSFISFVFLFILAFGISFQLPIFMFVLTSLNVVDSNFWKKYFSYAIMAIVVFGAIITPDGSGITMWFVAIPMILLYGLGYLVSRRLKIITK